MLYVSCIALILAGLPVLNVLAAIIAATAGLWCIRRSRGAAKRPEPKISIFLMLVAVIAIGNIVAAERMSKAAAEFIFAGVLGAPPPLWTTRPVPNRGVWMVTFVLFVFPLFALGMVGLTYLGGTFLEYAFGRRDNGDQAER